jgi:hypothetical protein
MSTLTHHFICEGCKKDLTAVIELVAGPGQRSHNKAKCPHCGFVIAGFLNKLVLRGKESGPEEAA